MRSIGIAVVLLLVTRVYLDPSSDGIESFTEALFWAGLGIWMVCVATARRRPRGRHRSGIVAMAFLAIRRRRLNERRKKDARQGVRVHRTPRTSDPKRPVG